MNRRTWLMAAGATALTSMIGPVRASVGYPSRTIKLIVPFLPGSTPDSTARVLADKIAPHLGQSLVVENRPGAGGIIGAGAVKRASNDGYTLGIFANTHVINVHMYRDRPYDPVRDFTPIAAISGGGTCLAVPASSPYKTVDDLIAALKSSPTQLNYGSGGKGSIAHLAAETFLYQTQTQAVHIPYKGATEIITSMLGGQTDFGMPVLGSAADYLRNGQLRALAITSSVRAKAFPDLPTMSEVMSPGFVMDNWSGLFGPADLPPDIAQILFNEVKMLQANGGLDKLLDSLGSELRLSDSPTHFASLVQSETDRYGKMMANIGMSGTNA